MLISKAIRKEVESVDSVEIPCAAPESGRGASRGSGNIDGENYNPRLSGALAAARTGGGFQCCSGRRKVRGCAKAEAVFTFAVAAYNLIRIPKLLAQAST